MHRQRLLTAFVASPVLFAVIWWGGPPVFWPVVVLSTGIACLEFGRLAFPDAPAARWAGVAAGLAPLTAAVVRPDPAVLAPALAAVLVLSALGFVATYARWQGRAFHAWAVFTLLATYLGFCAAHTCFLWELPGGKRWIVLLLVGVFAGDAGAYYVGRSLGRHKLAPALSKGKTVEGAFGGLSANAAAAFLLWYLLFPGEDPWMIILTMVAAGAAGQVGDLVASMAKRAAGAKDSGKLLPGHGGMLDRIDAVLFALPAFYWLLAWMQAAGAFRFAPG
ncbi:phosphatidate cytidylyltransferase [Dissulfurirhabdus thermomarina]|uniref:Phosphatidate cytidylyltransferase n=1 Tax=Dissulfurirhabdus thermomarina TaxID=1765737 RepID=A0A6N9TXC0_DISTH|nr:phosphatidate cytidylyltransferase [Dissulfurirhabdus thermomarina]NDY43126.1 phosphatidate cytidylyltransferase [Dissulfurirhabdus thermomarina]NMX23565.1 phosphatidate cytidylyltransferase [Dissulfurirhabdus thermomarina]